MQFFGNFAATLSNFNMRKLVFIIATAILLASCGEKKPSGQPTTQNENKTTVSAPQFNADSAYQFVAKQTSFGPRVPETEAHAACAEWLTTKLATFADTVIVQEFRSKLFNGKGVDGKNTLRPGM